jgi:hypothetical protein
MQHGEIDLDPNTCNTIDFVIYFVIYFVAQIDTLGRTLLTGPMSM